MAGDDATAHHDTRRTSARRARAGEVDRLVRALRERGKELDCLYDISSLLAEPDLSLAAILQRVVDLIPSGFQHSEVGAARVRLDEGEFCSAGFRDAPWRLAADLLVHGRCRGSVEVVYVDERPPADEGPFLREERRLLDAIAERLGRTVERLRAGEELEASRCFLETVLDGTPALIAVLDRDLNFLHVNRAYAEADQREPSFFLGKNHFDLYPNPENERIFRRVVETGEPHFAYAKPFEYAEHPERGVSHWDWSLVPVRGAGGNVERLLLTLVDVTPRIRAQEALRESEARFRQLAESVGDGFWLGTTGIDGQERRVLYANPAFAKIFGLPAEKVVVDPAAWFEAVHPRDRERVRQAISDFYHGRRDTYDIELRIVCPDGAARWIWVQGFAILDDRGRFYRVAVLVRDITERKRMERKLRRVRAQLARRVRELTAIHRSGLRLQELRSPQALAQDIIAVLEQVLEYEHGAVLLIDEATGSLVPFALSDQGRGAGFAQTDRAYVMSHDPRLGKGITGWVAETGRSVRVGDVRQDPRYYPMREGILSELCVPLRFGDRILGVLNVETTRPNAYTAADQRVLETVAAQVAVAIQNTILHERVQEQARLRLSRQAAEVEVLREVDRMRSELIANVSHEIRTPLGLIDVLSSSLLMDDVSFDPAVQREFLLGIKEATDRLTGIVENLLDLGRLDGGRLRPIRRPVDLVGLVRAALPGLVAHAADHKLLLDLEGEELVAPVDPGQMERVLANLVSNAVKYSPPGGTVRIGGRAQAGEVVLWVSDEGPGIAEEEQERIFERFYRVDSEWTRRTPGVGLGLAVCRSIVDAHGGRLWVESRPGAGSTFYVGLPGLARE